MVPRFLLVSLNIDAILGEVTISKRGQKLNQMTKGNHLGDAYSTTLARMKAQKGSRSRLGIEALMWVSNSERPLYTTELCHALGVKIGSSDLDVGNVPTIRTLLACSLGLITVDASSSTVRLVHFSLQEYLSNNLSLFQSPHSMIAEVCLTYLDFRCVRELSPLSWVPSTLPFVGYASGYWGTHMRKGSAGSVEPLALKLLLEFEQHISSQQLLRCYDKDKRWWEQDFGKGRDLKGFTGLHGAAFFGMGEMVATLLAMGGWDINTTDSTGRTALWLAAEGGHEGVVKLLLGREGIDTNTADIAFGLTPLCLAAGRGSEGVVKLLLEQKDINPNTADTNYGWTPLLWAAVYRHEGVVRLLLEREDINPNAADTKFGQTPLSRAVEEGNEGVVKLLLERKDTDPNTADTLSGQTPLSWAAECGNERIVKLLLERDDVNPDIPTLKGETALQLAASRGNERVVELLSTPRPSRPIPAGTDEVPKNPSPDPPDILQSPSQSTPLVSLPQPEPLPPNTQPLLGKAIGSFIIISSFVFLLFLVIISPSLTILSLSFHRCLLSYTWGVSADQTFTDLS